MSKQSGMTMEFHFVNTTTPGKPKDGAVRSLIRKQAMKEAVATRKRDGTYGRHNRRQIPFFVENVTKKTGKAVVSLRGASEDEASTLGGRAPSGSRHVQVEHDYDRGHNLMATLALTETIPASLSQKGYQLTSIKYGFDALNLSILTTVHVGRALGKVLRACPSRLLTLLRHKHCSYFDHLPVRYGHFPALNDAADCVLARVRQIISPQDNWEQTVMSLYVRAITSLQAALDSDKQRLQPEVLCAAEILSLYELLDTSREDAWVSHAAGAAELVKLRGPTRYTTDFERALLLAHIGPTITESVLNNIHCFLEEPSWNAVLQSIIIEDSFIDDRSEIVIRLLIYMSHVPGIFREVTELICSEPDPEPDKMLALTFRAYALRSKFQQWRRDFDSILACGPHLAAGSHLYDKQFKLLGVWLTFTIMVNRIIVSMTDNEGQDLELEAQSFATEILDLEQQVQTASPHASLFMVQKVGVARATKATELDWARVRHEGPVLERWKFERWCSLWGRKTYGRPRRSLSPSTCP